MTQYNVLLWLRVLRSKECEGKVRVAIFDRMARDSFSALNSEGSEGGKPLEERNIQAKAPIGDC